MASDSSTAEIPSFFRRYGLWGVILTFALAPIGGWAAFDTLRNLHNSTADWLPDEFEETRQYKWFIEHFQTDEILVASWPGCTIDDPRLNQFAEEVARAQNTDDPKEPYVWFQRVVTGRTVRDQLMDRPLERIPSESQRQEEAVRRMRGWLVGADGRTTCAIMIVSWPTVRDQARNRAVADVTKIAERLGIPRDDLHLGGPTIDTVAVDTESARSLYLLMTLSIGSGLLLSWWFLGSWRLVSIVVITAGMCEMWSLAMVTFLGQSMDMVLIMMPALVYILAVSGCIHQLNYYLEEARQHGEEGAAGRSLLHCWQPSILATGTTALGLASLMIGDVIPIKKFGAFAALGVILSLVFLFLFLPSLLEVWRPRSKYSRAEHHALPRHHHSPSQRISLALAMFGVRHYRPILILCLISVPFLGWGLLQTRTSVKLQHLFSDRAQVLQDYRWLEEHIGALIPVEMVVRYPRANETKQIDRLKLIERLREKIETIPGVGSTVTIANFTPPLPTGRGVRDTAVRSVLNSYFENDRDLLEQTHYLTGERDEHGKPLPEGDELWRISARVSAFADVDYAEFLEKLRAEVTPILESAQEANPQQSPTAMFSGGVPLVSLVQRRMLNDLASSFTTAFITIALTMAVMLRTLGGSLVMMIPNVMPPLLVFGLLGWTGTFIDLGSMMTISAALGISVDNELHFYAWFRRAVNRGVPYSHAVMSSFHHCGSAMAETSIICALGLVAFAMSPFVPVSRFGWLMFLLIGTAMIGDLVVMPALLASPLGWFFGRPSRGESPGQGLPETDDPRPLESDVPAGASES